MVMRVCCMLTSHDHHANGEDFLIVRFGCNVTESHRGHASHGVIQCRDVHGFPTGTIPQLDLGYGSVIFLEQNQLRVRLFADTRQTEQPTVLQTVDQIRVTNGVPVINYSMIYNEYHSLS